MVYGELRQARSPRGKGAARSGRCLADYALAPATLVGGEGPVVAHTRPTVAPAEGLLTEAVLKPVCVLPNRRPFRVASRNSKDGSKNRGRAQQGNCGQRPKTFRGRQPA